MGIGQVLLAVLGTGLLVVVTYDILITTITPSRGAGPITTRIGRWLSARMPTRRARTSRLTAAIGPLSLVGTLAVWGALFTCGWWALLATSPVHVPGEVRASALELLAHTVTSISSLGTGYVEPTTVIGRLLAALASLSGIGLLTLTVTYVLPVVTAVSRRQVLARRISALGETTTELIDLLGESAVTQSVIDDVSASLRGVTQDHLAYPILHHFRAPSRETALAPNLASLDEAVTALQNRADGPLLDPVPVRALRTAVEDLMRVTEQYLTGHTSDDAPPWPDQLEPGEDDPLEPDEHEQRRRRLAAYVREDGWDWEHDVHSPEDDEREPSGDPAAA